MSGFYIIKINNNLCGFYDNLNLATDFVVSCINCNFIKKTDKIIISNYKINTNICIQEIDFLQKKIINYDNKYKISLFSNKKNNDKTKIKLKDTKNNLYETDSKSDTSLGKKTDSDLESVSTTYSEYARRNTNDKNKLAKMNEVGIEKSNITQKINLLNLEKKKINEKENEFNYDLELYNKFKLIIKQNPKFIIPELFIEKFKIFEKLDDNNNLNFENFYDNYIITKIETDYDNLFNNTDHLNKFINRDNVDLNFNNENYNNLFTAAHNLSENNISTIISDSEHIPSIFPVADSDKDFNTDSD